MANSFLLLEDGGYFLLEDGGYLIISSQDIFIGLDNTFVNPNAPLVVEVGIYTTKDSGYRCITKLDKSEYDVLPITDTGIYKVNNNVVQCARKGDYTIAVYGLGASEFPPELFSFFVYDSPQLINKKMALQIIAAELPTIYKSSNPLNNADNNGIAAVLALVYKQVYTLFYGAITSIGESNSYNPNWEYVYLSMNKFLQNAVHPADFLKTLMQVPTKTGVSFSDLAIFASRLSFQFTGENTPVSVEYLPVTNKYNITIYIPDSGYGSKIWFLGSKGLGVGTYLGGVLENPFVFILSRLIGRLMPVTVKYNITLTPVSDFSLNYDISPVNTNDYIDASINYDAYVVVNNNNLFNTKGYFKFPLPPVTTWALGVIGNSELGSSTILN